MACDIVGIGLIEIKMYDGIVRILSNVRHVLFLKKNLISLGILDSFGYQYSATGGVIRVYKGSSVVMTGKKTDGLYFLQSNIVIGGAASSDVPDLGKESRIIARRWSCWESFTIECRYYELGPNDRPYAAKFFDCCGAEDPEASGCTTSFHVSYDDAD
ncbi:hypothetical protein F2P56_035213 [Juglans regia]|uniref:Uncharacterized protein LOC109004570 isoform X1 n=2 Tax=Juglans regia TaxID=51240 RepID=A0A6P9E4W3_JUGRE|nr:uncharacterized protein LOC109004570 isoform X1 [Juglans regia]KAF5442569.1 hypothetical protein F2P56_035213 [Juglans regia]